MYLAEMVAKNIRKHRERRNLTQIELAAKLDVTQAYVAHLENGRKVPSLDMLERLGAALRIPPAKLLAR